MISTEMLEIVGPAFAAGLMIALTHAPLGIEVLRRGIIFIDLAVAQIAGLGLVVASRMAHDPGLWLLQGMALAFALIAGLSFRWAERRMPEKVEAIIGCSFVLAASLTLLLLADHPHAGEEIQHVLSGQMLFVTWRDVLMHAPIYAVILVLWLAWPKLRRGIAFYMLFAVAVTSSVQLVGVYVVFASLIVPALAVSSLKHRMSRAWAVGLTSMGAGIGLAMLLDYPAGPVVVCSYVAVALLCAMVARLSGRSGNAGDA